MKKRIFCFLAFLITFFILAQRNRQIQDNDFIGKTFDYTIEKIHLNLQILSNSQVKWIYISAPNNETGKTAIENCTIKKISKGIYLIYWTEENGSNVVDIFNLNTKEILVNFTLPNAKMYNYQTTFKIHKN